MLTINARKMIRLLALCAFLGALSAFVSAQTPTPVPTPAPTPSNPAQRDATKPPGSEQNPNVPPEARPNTQSPTAPPGAPQTSPAAPPGTTTAGQAPAQQNPSAQPTPPEPGEPSFPKIEPKPLPPLPSLNRLGVNSDNGLTLSLNEAIKRALQNNNDIEVARDDVRYAETVLRSLQGIYQPVFAITPQIDKRVTPVSSIFAGGTSSGTVSNTVYTLSPSINKSFATGGGNYQLSFSNNKTITSATSSTLNPFYSSNLALSFTQPLLRNRSIDSNRHLIRIQKKRLEQSDADFRLRTISVISQVQSAYWDLVFALRDQQIQLENLNLSRENLKRVEAQIAAGAAAPLARAEVQTELANREATLLVAVQSVSIAENALKQLILKDATAPEWTAAITPTDAPSVELTPVNLNDAITEARKNRPELQRLRLQREINGIDLQYFRNQTRPQVDLQATIASTGLAGTKVGSTVPANLIGGYGQDLSNLAGFSTRNITVGVAIQIPLKNQTAQANLAGARIQKEQLDASVRSTEQVIEVDVRNAAQSVETARRRVVTARAARTNAELQLEGEQRLYSVGRSTTFLLFQRENALANARDAELRAETDYNKALAALQRATSTTLRANNVTVESSVP